MNSPLPEETRRRYVRRRVAADLYEVVRRSDQVVVGQVGQSSEELPGYGRVYWWVGSVLKNGEESYLPKRDLLAGAVEDVIRAAERQQTIASQTALLADHDVGYHRSPLLETAEVAGEPQCAACRMAAELELSEIQIELLKLRAARRLGRQRVPCANEIVFLRSGRTQRIVYMTEDFGRAGFENFEVPVEYLVYNGGDTWREVER